MPLYSYKALSTGQGGKTISGEIIAENDRHARSLLRETGVVPVSIEERPASRGPRAPAMAWLASFSRQLGTLLKAGFPMDKALASLASAASDEAMGAVLTTINEGVRRGLRLSESIGRSGGVSTTASAGTFSPMHELTAMVEAGEASGDLSSVLLNYAELLDRRLVFRRRLRGALFYPLIVAGIAVVVIAFLFIYVVPTITKLFEGTQMTLPLPTRILFFISNALQYGAIPGLIVIAAVFFFSRRFLGSREGRLRGEEIVYSLPMVGKILEKAAIARWARTFGSLLNNGVDILTALDIAARTSNSARIANAILQARPRVAEGVPLARAISETRAFPPLAIEAITIGEGSGALPVILVEMASGWEGEVEASAERFADMLEPLMLVIMGMIVGGIVLAILLPIFEFNSSVK